MKPQPVDLRSDTVTRPSKGMLEAMVGNVVVSALWCMYLCLRLFISSSVAWRSGMVRPLSISFISYMTTHGKHCSYESAHIGLWPKKIVACSFGPTFFR